MQHPSIHLCSNDLKLTNKPGKLSEDLTFSPGQKSPASGYPQHGTSVYSNITITSMMIILQIAEEKKLTFSLFLCY